MENILFENKFNMKLEDLLKFNKVHTKKMIIQLEVFILIVCVFSVVVLLDNFLFGIIMLIGFATFGIVYPIIFYALIKINCKKAIKSPVCGGDDGYDIYSFDNDTMHTKSINSQGEEYASVTLQLNGYTKVLVFDNIAYLYLTQLSATIIKKENMTIGTYGELIDLIKSKINPKIFIDKRH